jgi:hypothetical protein
MTNGNIKPWVKILIGVVATIVAVGIAYGTLITEVGHNTFAIQNNGDKIDKLDERIREEETKTGTMETDIRWIRETLEREFD